MGDILGDGGVANVPRIRASWARVPHQNSVIIFMSPGQRRFQAASIGQNSERIDAYSALIRRVIGGGEKHIVVACRLHVFLD
jgi:hypothetical protein